jgi:hypothetical protein
MLKNLIFSDIIREIVIASVATRSPTSGVLAIFGDCFVALRLLAMTLLNFLTFSTHPKAVGYPIKLSASVGGTRPRVPLLYA